MSKRRTRKEKLRAKKRRGLGAKNFSRKTKVGSEEREIQSEDVRTEEKVTETRRDDEEKDKLYVYPVKMIKRDLIVSLVIAGGVLIGEGLLYWGWEQGGLMGWLK